MPSSESPSSLRSCLEDVHAKLGVNTHLLRYQTDKPLVFLFDECHHDLVSKKVNIEAARFLVEKGIIGIIGVEGYAGGHKYDPHEDRYLKTCHPNLLPNSEWISNEKYFADAVTCFGITVVGIDSPEISDQLEIEYYPGNPYNLKRSAHFIVTLFDAIKETQKCGAILNAGGNHNDHIEKLVMNKSVDDLTSCSASFVRMRANCFPPEDAKRCMDVPHKLFITDDCM